MPRTRTRLLFAAAVVLSGVLAGGVIDRVIVGGPAWHELGAEAWAQYSRHADLGSGLVAYPIKGIGATLLIIAAAVSCYLESIRQPGVTIPLYCAVAFSVAGLLLTIKAAPIMLGLPTLQDAAAIERAFDEFFVWGLYLRGSVDTLAFCAVALALSNMRILE